MPLEEMIWVENYRPTKLENRIRRASSRESPKEKRNELPDLLFADSVGTVKPPHVSRHSPVLVFAAVPLQEDTGLNYAR